MDQLLRRVDVLGARIHTLQNYIHLGSKFTFADLFCGIGGFHQALARLGGRCVFACDIDPACRDVYERNYGLKPAGDITTINTADIPDVDVITAGFPCTSFSKAGARRGFEDTRGTLFYDVARILRDKRPKFFLLENVKNLVGHDDGNTWATIYKTLTDAGYTTYETPPVISPHHIGVPQHRERVWIPGIRNDLLTAHPLAVHLPSSYPDTHIRSILEDTAPPGTELKPDELTVLNLWEEVVQHFKAVGQKLPSFPMWSDDWDSTYSLKELPEWKAKFVQQNRDFYAAHHAFLVPWLARARAQPAFAGARRKFEFQAGNPESLWTLLFQFRPSGIRVKRPNYSPALVAMAQIVYVGEKRRKLSPREVARLQSFPESFILPASSSQAYKQFGNSVNVEAVYYIASQLLRSYPHS
jgi:DNA (cytosine-5)-methyltransferase 1